MERHSWLLGGLLLLFGMLTVFGIADALENALPEYARKLGFIGGGTLIAALDLTFRRVWGEGDGLEKYLRASRGPPSQSYPCGRWAPSSRSLG